MRIVFMGTGEIALPTLRWLLQHSTGDSVVGVFTQPDKKIGRKQVLTPPAAKTLAQEAGVPVFQPESLRRDKESLDELQGLAPDLIIVMAYGQILPRSVIEAPTLACVNLHASLLPRHRGASPIQAAIRDGDSETGITLMHVAPKLDSGDMIWKEAIPILPKDTGGTLHDRLAELGPKVAERCLSLFGSEGVSAAPQEEQLVTYAGKLEREDGRIDWTHPAHNIERTIRAYEPWPGTWTQLRGRKIKVFPTVEVAPSVDSPPGSVASVADAPLIACGEGSLRLRGELQWEGKKRLPAEEFLRGSGLSVGDIFDPE